MNTSPPAPRPARRAWLFGGLRLARADTPLRLPGGKIQALLAYLLLHPDQPHPREKLADLFWPHADPARVRRYLSDACYRLQQILGYDWLQLEPDTIRLPATADLWVDVWAFTDLASDPAHAPTAVSLYQADLLPELYDDWLLPIRVRLREQAIRLLTQLGRQALHARRLDDAFTHYHRLVTLDPLNEAAHRGLMRVYTQQQRPAAALAQFAQLEQILLDELGVPPTAESAALAAELRAAHAPRPAPAAPPFVGRRQERAALLTAATAALDGRGGVLLLEGAAGMGKTRLLEAVADGAAWRGLAVAWGRGAELTAVSPYAPLDAALRHALHGPRADQLRSRLSPETAAVLATLIPRLDPHAATPPDPAPHLPRRLLAALRALGDLAPLLLILDDVQWAGAAFWDVLPFAAGLADTAVCLVLAYRPDALRAHPPAWRALQQLDLAAAPRRITLAGLSPADGAELAAELGRPLPAAQLHALCQTTAGNPLYLLESLAAASASAAAAPPSLANLLQDRLARLSPPARAALEMAAVLGPEFAHGAWQAALGRPPDAALPELLAARFLHETAVGYRFQHDLTREQVYQALPPARLADLHRRAAAVLRQAQAPAETLAWHYAQAGAWEQALHFHRLAGEDDMRAFAYEAALAHFAAAAELAARHGAETAVRWPILYQQQRALEALGRIDAWQQVAAALRALAAAGDDPACRLASLETELQHSSLFPDVRAAAAAARQAIALAQQLGDTAAEARLRSQLGLLLLNELNRPALARRHLARAVYLAEAQRDPALQVTALGHLALAQQLAGQAAAGRDAAQRALALTHLHPGLARLRPHALQQLAGAARQQAAWETAWHTLNQAVAQFDALGDVWALGDALYDRVQLALAIGQLEVAQADLQRIGAAQRDMGIPPHAHFAFWTHTFALLTAVAAAAWPQAAELAASVAQWAAHGREPRLRLQALSAVGWYHLRQEAPLAALPPLTRAVALWSRAPSIELRPLFYHAIAAARAGQAETAVASLTRAEAFLAQGDAQHYTLLRHVARHLVTGDAAALQAARAWLQTQAAAFADAALRDAFLQRVYWHRWLLAAPPDGRVVTVRLARADAPLGRPLTPADTLPVQWTVDAGTADAAILQAHGKAALRRHRLQRLLAEAAAQGAAPTDDDLAAALHVSRRTIQRDMQQLQAAGHTPATRRRGT